MTDAMIYQGEDFALVLEAFSDETDAPADISRDGFELLLYTSPLGRTVCASTSDPDKIPILRRDDHTLAVNIPGKLTASFAEGKLQMEMAVIDAETGVREIVRTILLEVRTSKIGRL